MRISGSGKWMLLLIPITTSIMLTGFAVADHEEVFLVPSDELDQMLRKAFSTKRNHLEPDTKDKARTFIRNLFSDLQSDKIGSFLEEQSAEHLVYGHMTEPSWETVINYVFTIRGTKWGTAQDRPVVLAAHYDTAVNTPGVDDNGSGMVSMLSAAKYIADYLEENDFALEYTLLFVALDFEEMGEVNATGHQNLLGSHIFVENYLGPRILDKYNITGDSFQGAVILETIMNWNSTNHSQIVIPGSEILFPDSYQETAERGFPGDFISVCARTNDWPLATAFDRIWSRSSMSNKYSKFVAQLPFSDRPSDLPMDLWYQIADSFRSDHYRFWDYGETERLGDGA